MNTDVNWWLVVVALLISLGAIVGGAMSLRRNREEDEVEVIGEVPPKDFRYQYGDGSSGI